MKLAKEEGVFSIREEPFGFTFYNHQNLTHRFFKKDKLKPFLEEQGIKKYVFLPAKRKNYRDDIIYSPIRIYYELTLACNLHCRFCFNNSGKPRPNELTTQEVFTSLEKLREDNVLDIRFTGGELTCRPDWYKILEKAKNLGFVISVNTNGYFNIETAEKLASLNLEQITISVDGIKEHHEENRGIGSFDKTMDNIKRLHKLGVTLRINTLLSRLTLGDLEPFLEKYSQYITEINFFPIRFIGRGSNLESKYSITMEDFYQFNQRAKTLKKKYPNLHLMTFAKANRRTSINQQENKNLGLKIGTTSGITTFNIASDGGFWAGGYLPYIDKQLEMRNVKTDSVFEVWQKSQKLEALRNQGKLLKEFCYSCPENGNRCPGPIFEIETYRQLNPKTKNYYCIHGQKKPLLDKLSKKLPYRKNVAALIFKKDKYLLVQLKDWPDNLWKLPQGGLNKKEKKEEGIIRELREELGSNQFKIIKKFPFHHQYDWDKKSQMLAGFKWRGQRQTFFLIKFLGENIIPDTNEIKNICWVSKKELFRKISAKHPLLKGYKKTIKKMFMFI